MRQLLLPSVCCYLLEHCGIELPWCVLIPAATVAIKGDTSDCCVVMSYDLPSGPALVPTADQAEDPGLLLGDFSDFSDIVGMGLSRTAGVLRTPSSS